jgi:glycosyltransferase involved in cell wall biosynthesis
VEKLPISVLIPVLNEEKNLAELLPLLDWAAEIVVVDSFSTDQTQHICEQYQVKFLQRKYDTPAAQKNWAIPQCAHEWLLIVDADERPKTALIAEIATVLNQNSPTEAYWIYRENYFLNQKINHSGWNKDKVVRLIRRHCRYNNNQVHEEIETKGLKVDLLKNRLEHYTYVSLDHFIDKLQRYATWAAIDYEPKTPKVGIWQLYFKPVFRFFKHYIWQKGFLDGRAGLIIAFLMAFGVFLRYAKLYERRLKQ